MKKLVYYCPYYGLVHLCLIKMGWEEHHSVYVGEERVIKMVKWFPIEVANGITLHEQQPFPSSGR